MSFIPFAGRSYGLPLSVRAGGHDAGRALSEGVVIDLSQMRTVTVDPDTAHSLQAGATISDLIEATAQYGLVTAQEPAPPLAWLDLPWRRIVSHRSGWVLIISSAQVVTADNATANAEEHPALWDYAVEATLALSFLSIACIHSRPCYLGCCSSI